MDPQYQVLTVDVGCCSGVLPTDRIAALGNQMADKGYRIQNVFVDVRTQLGPFCPKRCAIIVFVKA